MANWRPGLVFIGMETSGALRRSFQALGFETYSCDLLPAEDEGGENMIFSDDNLPLGRHLVGDVQEQLDNMWANDIWPDLAVFHPTCTYLTISAEWAYKDPDFDRYPGVGYHQRLKPETLFGAERRAARDRDVERVRELMALPIRRKVFENPVGVIGSRVRPVTEIHQPYEYGDDASKQTCTWYIGKDGEVLVDMVVPRDPAKRVPGRVVDGRERWANQTDSGQNKLGAGTKDRWKERSRTYPGVANAWVAHWASLLSC